MIEYQMNIREESFGATILNLKNGQREYLNTSELKKILEFGIFPNNSCIKKDDKNLNIKYIKNFNKKNHFSFADIAYIEITHECNLRCKHCLNNSGNKIPNQLNDDEIFNLIIEFSKAGMQEIRFTGGEPLVYNKIYEFIFLAHKLGINGTLIIIEEAKKLKLAGLNKTIVRIDGTEVAHVSWAFNGDVSKELNIKLFEEFLKYIKDRDSKDINVDLEDRI